MATVTTYHVGGFVPAAPQQNRASLLDSVSGLFTEWDESGAQTLQRPLAAEEVGLLAAQDLASAAATNRATIEAKLDAAIATNIAVLALPDPTPGNTTYLALAAIPAGTLTAAALGNALRPVRLQVDALTRQNNALRDQVVALTRQITALERHIANRLDDVSGT